MEISVNKQAKGYRHEAKTVKWLEGKGYDAQRVRAAGNARWGAQDFWGADVLAAKEEELVAVQVKSNRGHMAAGLRALLAGRWPRFVRLLVVHWPRGRSEADGPETREAERGKEIGTEANRDCVSDNREHREAERDGPEQG